MKKFINKEVEFCDECKKESSLSYQCLSCGKEVCYDCHKKLGINFDPGVNWSGSGSGYFCNQCISKPIKNKELLQTYFKIQSLREESKNRWEDFEKRVKEAEAEVKRLRG